MASTKKDARWERLPIQFTPEQYEYLRLRSFEERTPIAALVRELVEARRQKDSTRKQVIPR